MTIVWYTNDVSDIWLQVRKCRERKKYQQIIDTVNSGNVKCVRRMMKKNGEKYFSKIVYYLTHNKLRLFVCQIFFVFVTIFFSMSFTIRGFYTVIKKSGYNALTKANFIKILTSPSAIIYIVMMVFIICLMMLLNVVMCTVLMDEECRSERKTVFGYLVQTEKYFFRFVFSKRVSRIFYMLPFAYAVYLPLGIMISVNNVVIRHLMQVCIKASGAERFFGVCIGLYILSLVIVVKKFPYISYLVIADTTFKTAAVNTKVGIKKGAGRFCALFLFQVLTILTCVLVYAAMIVVSIFMLKFVASGDNILTGFYETFEKINFAAAIIFFVLCGVGNMTAALEVSESHKMKQYLDNHSMKQKNRYAVWGLIIIVSLISVYLDIRVFLGGNISTYSNMGNVTICAHRGASSDAPENTVPAVLKAIEEGADYVEIDVRLTSDGQVVLMHDATTKRTTDGNLKVSEATYDELSELDAGIKFSEEYAGTKIPTLEEVMDVCRGKIMMNIELKPSGSDGELERKVAELITDKFMVEQCVVTSFKQKSLIMIKKLNPDIVTGYIYSFGYSNNLHYEAMDILSMDAKYLTRAVVSGAHRKGITVFAWTVNKRQEMRRMVSIGVDNIITDKVAVAKEIIYEKNDNKLMDIWKYLASFYTQ